jgi:hypothetical protein
MFPANHHNGMQRLWRLLIRVYLWISVAMCSLAAFVLGFLSQDESAKLIGAAFLLFAGVGVAFARALPRIQTARWWHWVLGAVLISPAVMMAIR